MAPGVAGSSGFDTAATPGAITFAAALLRAPDAASRVSVDFGSNSNAAFTSYAGYAAMTYTGLSGAATPVRLYARTGANTSLLNSTTPYTQFTGATPTPSTAMVADTDYRGTLTLQNTGSGIVVGYTLRDAATSTVVMQYSAVHAASPSLSSTRWRST